MADLSVKLDKSFDGFENFALVKEMEELYDKHFEDLFYENKDLKEAARAVLYLSMTNGRGGYSSEFGIVTCGQLIKGTGFDMNKREINKKDD